MALKDTWTDKVDGRDDVVAKDINDIAHSVIGAENELADVNQSIDAINNELKNISDDLNDKVEKVDGKGLSSNDFTDADKEKLNNLPTKAENDEAYASKTDLDTAKTDLKTEITELDKKIGDEISATKDELQIEIKETAKEANDIYSNALKGSASGAVIRIDDVSPVEHTMKVKLSSKNLLSYPYTDTTKTSGEITFTDNGDGSITLHGTATGTAIFVLSKKFNFVDGVTYAVSGGENLFINYLNENGEDKYFHTKYNTTLTWDKRYTLKRIYLQVSSGATKDNEVIYPMLEVGNTPTSYTPYIGDLTSVSVNEVSKNLLPYPYVSHGTGTLKGIEYVDNGDGSIALSGTADNYFTFTLTNTFNFVGGVTYCISTGDAQCGIVSYKNENGTTKYVTEKLNNVFTWDERWTLVNIYLQVATGVTVNTTAYPMIEIGNTPTEYEPYKEPTTYAANADGTVEGVTSMYPNTTITTGTEGVVVDCAYNRDLNKAFAELQQTIISLGGNV